MNQQPMPSADDESLLDFAQRLKSSDRAELGQMEPGAAQLSVDQVLQPAGWEVLDPAQWCWPGDLGDPAETPDWMTEPDG